MTNPEFDRPTRKDVEDIILEIEETIQLLRGKGGYENTIRELEQQAERLKGRLKTL